MKNLFEINPEIDRLELARRFLQNGRVQVRNVLTPQTAQELLSILKQQTRWSMAIFSDENAVAEAKSFKSDDMMKTGGAERVNQAAASAEALSAEGRYAFRYAHYPIVDALNERWDPNGPHEILLEHLNAPEFLNLVREVTGIKELIRADAQATLFAANHVA